MRMILALAVKRCSKSPHMTRLYRSASSGNWCRVLLVAAEESLDPRRGISSNSTEPGDKVDSSCVLLSDSSGLFEKIGNCSQEWLIS